MKICLSCGFLFEGSGWQCRSCHTSPELLEGFPAFAPNLAETNDGFEATAFDQLALLEANNFWFRSRNQLVIWSLGRYFRGIDNFLEIGCGTGYVLSGLEHAFLWSRADECACHGLDTKSATGQGPDFQYQG